MAGRVQDKVAVVAGAGSVTEGWGNGRATAVLLAREGAKIFALDINPDAVAETGRLIESEQSECTTHVCDVTDGVQVAAVVEACLARYGRIDILHNNVGASVPGGPVEMTEEDWDAQMALNLKSVFLTCKHVLPVMEKQGQGAIVNVSSVAGVRYIGKDQVGYAASKAGLIQFGRAVALKYAAKGIRCNTVLPGLMHTPLVEYRLADQYAGGDLKSLIEERNAMVPMGHMGEAWDVAYAALYLASDEAKYVTASELVVDGGFIAACD